MFEWDRSKAKQNATKHGIAFGDTFGVFEDANMKANYDFSKARRGAVLPSAGNKVRITIRLDREIVDWFRARVEAHGGGNYQTMLNDALHAFIGHQDPPLEAMLRRVVREEIRKAS